MRQSCFQTSGAGLKFWRAWVFVWLWLAAAGSFPAWGQDCPGAGGPPPVAGLGSGPGSADRSFGYTGTNFTTLDASMAALLQRIGNIIPAPGEIRAIAVQRLDANANKFIVAGNFTYRDPATGTTYRNIMRLNANGTIDAPAFTPTFFPSPINALAVDSQDRIVVGGEFIIPGPPDRSRLLRLLPD